MNRQPFDDRILAADKVLFFLIDQPVVQQFRQTMDVLRPENQVDKGKTAADPGYVRFFFHHAATNGYDQVGMVAAQILDHAQIAK